MLQHTSPPKKHISILLSHQTSGVTLGAVLASWSDRAGIGEFWSQRLR